MRSCSRRCCPGLRRGKERCLLLGCGLQPGGLEPTPPTKKWSILIGGDFPQVAEIVARAAYRTVVSELDGDLLNHGWGRMESSLSKVISRSKITLRRGMGHWLAFRVRPALKVSPLVTWLWKRSSKSGRWKRDSSPEEKPGGRKKGERKAERWLG